LHTANVFFADQRPAQSDGLDQATLSVGATWNIDIPTCAFLS
jgi:hypothetical protein